MCAFLLQAAESAAPQAGIARLCCYSAESISQVPHAGARCMQYNSKDWTMSQPLKRHLIRWALSVLLLGAHSALWALDLSSLSKTDAVSGLKDALGQASGKAIAQLGIENGFLNNAEVKIPLPAPLQRIESGLRMFGMQGQADALVNAMNHAAEQAVPEASALFADAIRKMSVDDAKGILTGSDTAATDYFQKTTRTQLAARFLPIVTKATQNVDLAEKYNQVAGKAAQMGLLDEQQSRIENYVTQKALDGLFLMMSEQEKAIRKDPVGTATGIARKVFGLLQ